jgi:uncharacterized protein with GYD domain
MSQFVMLTRLAPSAVRSPKGLEKLERAAMSRVREVCPDVEWVKSWALLGRYDYLDVFEAPSIERALQVATIIRTFGHAHTEVWGALEWNAFKELAKELPGAEE